MHNEEKILQMLADMQAEQKEFRREVTEQLKSTNERLDSLQTDVDEIKLNVRYIWEDIAKHDKQIFEMRRVK